MSSILKRALSLITGDDVDVSTDWLKMPKNRPLKQFTERELIKLESQIGAQLFGPIPTGRRREFFNLDPVTWIWHEEWLDDHRRLQTATTRYEIQEKGVLKVQDGARYTYLEGAELDNLRTAIHMYYERVCRDIYEINPDTGSLV